MHASLPDEAFAFDGAVVVLARIRDAPDVAYAALLGAALCRYAALGGRLADRVGPRVPLIAGAVTMAAAAVPAAVSATLGAFVASRLAVGVGGGLMMSAAVLWLLRLAGPGRRGRALGHIGLANYGGLAVGPLVAGALGGVAASCPLGPRRRATAAPASTLSSCLSSPPS